MAIIGHGVCNTGAEQAFDRAQQGERDHRSDELLEVAPFETRDGKVGQLLGDAAELGADGFYGQSEERNDNGGQNQNDDRGGETA